MPVSDRAIRPDFHTGNVAVVSATAAARQRGLTLALFVACVTGGTAFAQPRVVYVDGNPYQHRNYWIDFSRRNGPTTFELHTAVSTLREVQEEIRKIQAWDAAMKPSTTGWRIAVIQISVKPGMPKGTNGGGGPSMADRIASLRQALTKLRNEILTMRLTPGMASRNADAINRMIDRYNEMLAQGRRDFGQTAVNGFSPEARIPVQQWYYDAVISGRSFRIGPFKTRLEAEQHWSQMIRQHGRNARRLRVPYTLTLR
jgi:hypothetical protein